MAPNRQPGVGLEKTAGYGNNRPITLSTCLKRAGIHEGTRSGVSPVEAGQLREAIKRIRPTGARDRSVRACPGPVLAAGAVTGGHENASGEYNGLTIKNLVTEKTKDHN